MKKLIVIAMMTLAFAACKKAAEDDTAAFLLGYIANTGGGSGAVITAWQPYNLNITATTTNPTKGTVVVDKAMWRRVGDSMEITYTYLQSAAGTSGSGTYLFAIPSGYTIDATKIDVDTDPGRGVSGIAFLNDGLSGRYDGWVTPYDVNNFSFSFLFGGALTQINNGSPGQLISFPVTYSFAASVPIVEFR